jgi:heparosan-N-sulfate-glucuronate 5-epimerase
MKEFLATPIVTVPDAHGIPMTMYGNRFGTKVGNAYNPLNVVLYGLSISEDLTFRGLFDLPSMSGVFVTDPLEVANFLVGAEVHQQEFAYWPYNFYWPTYHMRPPWRSAMAEALGGTFLLAVGRKEAKYWKIGLAHLESLLVPVEEGGLHCEDPKGGGWWFPEFVDSRKESVPYVLNGMLYTLLAIRRSAELTRDTRLVEAYKRGLKNLVQQIAKFDGGYFSYYDSFGNPANTYYHKMHVRLLARILEINSDSVLESYRRRWQVLLSSYAWRYPISLLQTLIVAGKIPFS